MSWQSSEDVTNETLKWLDQDTKGGFPTGFAIHDQLVGQFHPEELSIIAARPGMGKTALAVSIAQRQAALGINVYFLTLEMGYAQVGARMLSHRSGVDLFKLMNRKLSDFERDQVFSAAGEIREMGILWQGTTDLREILKLAKETIEPQSRSILYVDYVGLVSVKGLDSESYERVSRVAVELKRLSKHLKIPVVLLSQLNRAVESRKDKRPIPSDLAESGKLEHHATLVMMLYRPGYYQDSDGMADDKLEIYVCKNRMGPTGRYTLRWNGPTASVSDWEPAE